MGQYYFSASQVLHRRKQQRIAKQHALHETLSVILIAIWFIGLGTGITGNGWIHLLLIASLGVAFLRWQPKWAASKWWSIENQQGESNERC